MRQVTRTMQYLIAVIAAVILGALTLLMAYERNTIHFDTYEEAYSLVRRSVPLSLVMSVGLLLLSGLVCAILQGRSRKCAEYKWWIIPLVAAIAVAVECTIWNVYYPYSPIADQEKVWEAAVILADGGTEHLDIEYYFSSYPQQKCMAVVFSLIVRALGEDWGISFRIVNAVAASAVAAALCVLCYQIFHRRSVMVVTAVLTALFAPHIIYSSFGYGTQMALACVLCGFICALQYVHTNYVQWLLPCWILMPTAVLLYMNSLIAIIALMIVIVLHLITQNWRQAIQGLIIALCIPVIVLAARYVTMRYFNNAMHCPGSDGVPTEAWIAMGITSDSEFAVGGYTVRGLNLYYDYGTEQAREISRQDISDAISDYVSGQRSLTFFIDKTICQWCDPWFSSAVMTVQLWNDDANESDSYREFMQGNVMRGVENWLTLYVSTSYLAAFLAICEWIRRRRVEPGRVLLVLFFIGGWLFQFAWEAKARYCYPYYMMLIPMFAYEIVSLGDIIGQFIKSRRESTFEGNVAA